MIKEYNNLLGNKILTWGEGSKIKVLEVLEVSTGKTTEGMLKISYKVFKGKKVYTLWCYPESLKPIV